MDLQACGAVGLLGIFAFDFVTKLGRNEVSAKHDFLRITGVTEFLFHGNVFLSFDMPSHYVHYA